MDSTEQTRRELARSIEDLRIAGTISPPGSAQRQFCIGMAKVFEEFSVTWNPSKANLVDCRRTVREIQRAVDEWRAGRITEVQRNQRLVFLHVKLLKKC